MKNKTYKIKTEEALTLEKRTYLPGIVLKHKCDCGENLELNFSSDYLSYPTVGKKTSVIFYCGECDSEYEQKVKINMTLDVEEKVKKL